MSTVSKISTSMVAGAQQEYTKIKKMPSLNVFVWRIPTILEQKVEMFPKQLHPKQCASEFVKDLS